jgi:predicted dehydrogenase
VSSAPLHGLLYGHGHMGRLHRARLEAREGIRLSIVDPAQGMVASTERPDFAVIATPTDEHIRIAGPLLEAGIPCLVEKPLAFSAEEARTVAHHPHLFVGHSERFNPALEAVAQVRPRYIEAERLSPFRSRSTDIDVVSDLMIHDLDLAMHFLGGELKDVRAVGVGVVSGCTDIARARLELGDGVASLCASRVSQKPVRRIRLFEDGLYWSVDLLEGRVSRVRWGEKELSGEPVAVPIGDALEREHEAFLSMVRGEAPAQVSGAEALAVLELAEAIRGAIQS